MRLLLLLLVLLASTIALAQPGRELIALLETKNLDSLDKFLKKTSDKDQRIYPKSRREIIDGYNEQVLEYYYHNWRTGDSAHYRINLLAAGKKLIYYRLADIRHNRMLDLSKTPLDKTVLAYCDNTSFKAMCADFEKAYGTTLDTLDLFHSDIVYGRGCGFVGMDPPFLVQMTRMVENNDMPALREWLHSPNAEKQLYAARAYRYLALNGYKTTESEQRWLSILANRKGQVNTCSGCIYSYMLISVEYNYLLHFPKKLKSGLLARNW